MYGAPYIFYFVHPLVKTAKMMVQRVNFERNLKKIRHATVLIHFSQIFLLVHDTQCSQFVPTGSYVTKEQFAHEFCVFLNVACIYSLQIGLTEKPAI